MNGNMKKIFLILLVMLMFSCSYNNDSSKCYSPKSPSSVTVSRNQQKEDEAFIYWAQVDGAISYSLYVSNGAC
jgi:hypothetical protein